MEDLYLDIEIDKKRYLEYVKSQRDFMKHIVIFGAGRMAIPLCMLFKENGINIDAFIVSDGKKNKEQECGIPIYQIDQFNGDREKTLVMFGVNPRLNNEVERVVKENGYKNYILASEYIRYFGKYQEDFFNNPMMEITTKIGCAVNCKFCPQDVLLRNYFNMGNEEKYLSLDMFKRCVDKLPQNTLVEFAGFTEPFFNDKCIDMIIYTVASGRKVNLFTTLRGVNQKILDALLKIQFEEFVLHVPDEEGYSNIPITPEYMEMLNQLIVAKKPDGRDFVDYACSQGTIPSQIQKKLESKVRIFVSLLDRAGNLEDEELFSKRNIRGKIRCEVSRSLNHNVLLPDGRVAICAQDYALKHVLGNLADMDYSEIMQNSKKIENLMSDEEDKSIICRNCSLAHCVEGKNDKFLGKCSCIKKKYR